MMMYYFILVYFGSCRKNNLSILLKKKWFYVLTSFTSLYSTDSLISSSFCSNKRIFFSSLDVVIEKHTDLFQLDAYDIKLFYSLLKFEHFILSTKIVLET